MRRFLQLPCLASAVWISWGLLLVMLLAMVLFRLWHPHYLPVTLLVTLFGVCCGTLMLAGINRLTRGPERWRNLGWLLIGVAPLWFGTGHVMYGFKAGHSRRVRLDLFQKLLIPLGESMIDLESRFRYPQRTVGEKVVMISAPVDDAAEQVVKMDAHIRSLEQRLGRQIAGQIHWFRGPLLGMQGRALFGVCMGSRVGEANPDAGGLDTLDRHEVAHCVINHFCSIGSEPPALFSEGWAQANMGTDEQATADNAWSFHNEGADLTLPELTGPEWVGRHEWPVYVQGAPLVNYLLREYGAERFLQLYTTGRRSHFREDCRRILGVDLNALDRDYWADIERQATVGRPRSRRRLEAVRLAPGINREEWQGFLEEYFSALPRLLSPYAEARLKIDVSNTPAPERSEVSESSVGLLLIRSGDCRFAQLQNKQGESAAIASPAKSLQFQRSGQSESWKPKPAAEQNTERAFRRIRHYCDQLLGLEEAVAPLVSDRLQGFDPADSTLTELTRFDDDRKQYVRLSFHWGLTAPGQRQTPRQNATFVFAMDDDCCLKSFRYESPWQVTEGLSEYDYCDGVPLVRGRKTSYSDPKGARLSSDLRLTEYRSQSMLPEEFIIERLLDSPVDSGEPVSVGSDTPPSLLWDWYRSALFLGAVCLVAGAGLLFRTTKTRRGLTS